MEEPPSEVRQDADLKVKEEWEVSAPSELVTGWTGQVCWEGSEDVATKVEWVVVVVKVALEGTQGQAMMAEGLNWCWRHSHVQYNRSGQHWQGQDVEEDVWML